jgi:hypothetical protein
LNHSAQPSSPSLPRPGWLARLIGAIGAFIIYRLIALFGRTHRWAEVPWLEGPLGEGVIGDAPYAAVAAREGLTLSRQARDGGLVPDFDVLRSDDFDPDRLHPLIRDFYEHTASFAMDVWSKTYFPTNVALYLLVTTISRQVNQLNFPLSPLDTALGISSEIISLRRRDGSVRYTGWFRTIKTGKTSQTGSRSSTAPRVLFTGFYMTARVPNEAGACVKVVFPMPHGNATVVLRPAARPDGSFTLDSHGRRLGDAGFYRLDARDEARVRVWHIRTLREFFHVYVDEAGALRCDHSVRFLGLPVLRLHYKIFRVAEQLLNQSA